MWFFAMIIILLILLVWLTRVREDFIDMNDMGDLGKMMSGQKGLDQVDPQKLFKEMRSLLDRYDKPALWEHAAAVSDKDPGELARMNLGITN